MKLILQAWHANGPSEWTMAAALFLGSLLALIVARNIAEKVVAALARRERMAFLAKVPAALIASTRQWLLLPLSLYIGATAVELPARLDSGVLNVLVIGSLVQIAFWINALVNLWLTGEIEKRRATDGEAVTALALMQFSARVLVWTLILLVILNHLNFNISALVTGLGVGGVAVALAVQNILGDLFASLSIVLDKPFVVGDFIIVDNYMGAVENVGLKTTRVRSLSGELIIFSNADLLKSRVRNYKRMVERRASFLISVAYGTSEENLRAIPGLLREAVLANDQVRFERAHFKEFGESALVFEVAYYVLNPDNTLYMDIQQQINLAVYRQFAARDIAFAQPTRVLRVAGEALPAEADERASEKETAAGAAAANQKDARRASPKQQQTGDTSWTRNAIA
jgi:small-conductance mechanosensitive channel